MYLKLLQKVDIMEKINTFFVTGGLEWKNVYGGLYGRSIFQKKVKEHAPQVKGIRCIIHWYAFTSKTLPASLQEAFDLLIKIVNYIKSGAFNTHLFKEFYRHEC